MTNTSTKRVRYYYSKQQNNWGYVEMLWAVDPNVDKAFWWSSSVGWRDSTMTDDVLKYFQTQSHLLPVSLYQVQHMKPRAYKPLV
jgi:hypothetical protein